MANKTGIFQELKGTTAQRVAYRNAKRDTDLAFIAREHGIETLETRNSDGADFHEVSVWGLKRMLEDAYAAGRSSK